MSLFGPGYGECAVVHCGSGQWIIVDSLIDRATRRPVALDYLNRIAVNVSSSVRLIVASHWHEDHVRGISALADACPNARIAFSNVFRSDEFLTLVDLAQEDPPETNHLAEFARLFRLPNRRLLPVAANMVLHRSGSTVLWALSPTPQAQVRAIREIAALFPKVPCLNPQPVSRSANHSAVVLLLVHEEEGLILLGSDLEESSTGWSAITSDPNRPSACAAILKVAHHGSESANHISIWTKLLAPRPPAALAPFRRGLDPLPKPTDVSRIKGLASALYSTAPVTPGTSRPRMLAVERTMKEVLRSRKAIEGRIGHVRIRRLLSAGSPITVDRFNGAVQL